LLITVLILVSRLKKWDLNKKQEDTSCERAKLSRER